MEDEELKKIFNQTNYMMVYEALDKYVKIENFQEHKKMQNKLFIQYLKEKYPFNENNCYEKMAARMSMLRFADEVLEYLLSLEIDLAYKGVDMFDTPYILRYLLANNIKNKELMQIYLEKVKDVKLIYFQNGCYRPYTDLCRMNIIAGNLEQAFKIFESDDYHLINIDYTSDIKIIDLMKNFKNNFYVDSLGFAGFVDHDMLYQIVLTIKDSDLSVASKKSFLKAIIYSNKIKLFNASSLYYIDEILDNDEYQKFIQYLKEKINSRDIYLFNILNRNTIYQVELENVKTKIKEM